jgi:hypothetical protein
MKGKRRLLLTTTESSFRKKDSIYHTFARRIIMAKPIELGLPLEGNDAERFQKYIDNPTFPKEGLQ